MIRVPLGPSIVPLACPWCMMPLHHPDVTLWSDGWTSYSPPPPAVVVPSAAWSPGGYAVVCLRETPAGIYTARVWNACYCQMPSMIAWGYT